MERPGVRAREVAGVALVGGRVEGGGSSRRPEKRLALISVGWAPLQYVQEGDGERGGDQPLLL
jgi:hypothetical protein